ncbi:MAG: ABC transporter permease [Actinobacteria bacterium]|nr:ABC transporter permease [Actinomycetota bacterium]MCG2807469.1 ABC transporter permease [Coriobacteriia bacterium]
MRRMLAMLRVSGIQILRDRSELISIVVLPLVLTYVFGVAFGAQGADRPIAVLWLEGDTSAYASQIRELVDTEAAVEVVEVTRAEADKKFADGDATIAVRVPKGFGAAIEAGDAATVDVEQAPGSTGGTVALEVVQGAVARVSADVQAARMTAQVWPKQLPSGPSDYILSTPANRHPIGRPGLPPVRQLGDLPPFDDLYNTADSFWEPDPPIGVNGKAVAASDVRGDNVLAASNTQYSVGFTIMFVLFMAFGSAGGILEEREQGTLRRLLVTPSTRAHIVGGKLLGVIGTSSFEAMILVGLGALAFGVPWGRDPLALLLVLGSYILASAGLAVFVTSIVRTRSQLSAIGPVASTGLAMIGGCYWPIEITPTFMQNLAKFTPTGWAMSGLLDVVARGQGLEAAWLPAGVLLGMAVVAFGAGLFFLKIE